MRSLTAVTLLFVLHSCSVPPLCAQDSRAVYLLFATWTGIYRMYPNGSDVQLLVRERMGGVTAVDYHYRLDYMFWSNLNNNSIKRAHLNGSDITTIVKDGLKYPADLAVDWINDKLYWTDRDYKLIEEYNLRTSHRRVVVHTGLLSHPLGIAVYPYPGYGWLYWADRGSGSIERVAVTGDAIKILHMEGTCNWPITLDYSTHTIYWMDYCLYRIESLNMNGDSVTHSIPVRKTVLFSYGISQFEDTIYWTEPTKIFGVNKSTGQPVVELYRGYSNNQLAGLEVVHASKQPPAEEFVQLYLTPMENMTCEPLCQNGQCIFPNLCACSSGWTGLDCSVDINECALDNGECQQTCTNLVGSFECSCNSNFVLGLDRKSCEDRNECEEANGGCEQQCVNLLGSYDCTCYPGFAFVPHDNMTCEDIDECGVQNGGCDHNCTNLMGSHVCSCQAGYTLLRDGKKCENASLVIIMTSSGAVTLSTSTILLSAPTSVSPHSTSTILPSTAPTDMSIPFPTSVGLSTSVFPLTSDAITHTTIPMSTFHGITSILSTSTIPSTNTRNSNLTTQTASIPMSSSESIHPSGTTSTITQTTAATARQGISASILTTILPTSAIITSSQLQAYPTSSSPLTHSSSMIGGLTSTLIESSLASKESQSYSTSSLHSTLAPHNTNDMSRTTMISASVAIITNADTAIISKMDRTESVVTPSMGNKLHSTTVTEVPTESSVLYSTHHIVVPQETEHVTSAVPTTKPTGGSGIRDGSNFTSTIIVTASASIGAIFIIIAAAVAVVVLLYVKCISRRRKRSWYTKRENISPENSVLRTSSQTSSSEIRVKDSHQKAEYSSSDCTFAAV